MKLFLIITGGWGEGVNFIQQPFAWKELANKVREVWEQDGKALYNLLLEFDGSIPAIDSMEDRRKAVIVTVTEDGEDIG